MHGGGRLCKWLTGRGPVCGLVWSLLLAVSSTKHLVNLLAKRWLDIAPLHDKQRGLHYLRQTQIDNVVPLTPPLAVRPIYLYLADRHRALAPIVAEELRVVKLSAEITELDERFPSR